MQKLIPILLIILTSSCKKYNLEITPEYRAAINHYRVNDTIYFKNQFGDLDTLRISSIDSIRQQPILGSVPPMKEIYLRAQHLPDNNWKESEIAGSTKPAKDQAIICAYNWEEACCSIRIEFRDFEGYANMITDDNVNAVDNNRF